MVSVAGPRVVDGSNASAVATSLVQGVVCLWKGVGAKETCKFVMYVATMECTLGLTDCMHTGALVRFGGPTYVSLCCCHFRWNSTVNQIQSQIQMQSHVYLGVDQEESRRPWETDTFGLCFPGGRGAKTKVFYPLALRAKPPPWCRPRYGYAPPPPTPPFRIQIQFLYSASC